MSTASMERAYLRKMNQMYPSHCVEVPREEWPQSIHLLAFRPSAVWRSRTVLVQQYPMSDGATRLTVSRTEIAAGGGFADGLTWEKLQAVKRECGFGDRTAVELFPPDACVVNVANMRHPWILDEAPRFMWRPKHAQTEKP